ncbi:nucleotide pyrophosphohydrolase [Chlamydia muridarum str. Nigg]|jgi:Predicted pyrophosphatase|uniref:Nucleotide pyrophosphohydrolase n=2 Tax=Chlamydia muridarum TaxID=83560 RepID=A0A069ZYR6_CHLMR|nr:MazG nucleotide pyrophosphohydrolase domain-containing protein [Chlamydia muridarum]UFW37668.1 nucleotide pyrophosphohydrolase [Chlamydia trachomatis]AAF39368.1 conserved hypothetical protein [Chlamydia muridarum str. Nigg]AHH22915.1 nucleotide pyrophosphohydrolase [Chlamydia muridarum str. Nigg3 CMUT3-5]AHH23840.1 nucleotide pyrophosphohydrolase [Chlamydia muridarum str. Nigg CM972]AID38049.1 nucleotide pyrophosphohydrolase [Chlamydia muridarum str. Nigg 2 MCR]
MEESHILQLAAVSRAMALQGVCPWTNLQSIDSMLRYILGECQELADAVKENKASLEIASEAGDVLTLVLTLCFLLEREGKLKAEEVFAEAIAKLRRRSPHVFDPDNQISLEEAAEYWSRMKEQEKIS